jgi:hypothetical protein
MATSALTVRFEVRIMVELQLKQHQRKDVVARAVPDHLVKFGFFFGGLRSGEARFGSDDRLSYQVLCQLLVDYRLSQAGIFDYPPCSRRCHLRGGRLLQRSRRRRSTVV